MFSSLDDDKVLKVARAAFLEYCELGVVFGHFVGISSTIVRGRLWNSGRSTGTEATMITTLSSTEDQRK